MVLPHALGLWCRLMFTSRADHLGTVIHLQKVSLKTFIRRTTPYERWYTPFDHRLSELCKVACGVHIGTYLFVWLVAPMIASLLWGEFGIVFGQITVLAMAYLYLPLVGIATIGLILATVLWFGTKSLSAARPLWHRVAFVHVLIGCLETFLVGLVFFAVAINLTAWILIYVAIAIAVILVLGVILSPSR